MRKLSLVSIGNAGHAALRGYINNQVQMQHIDAQMQQNCETGRLVMNLIILPMKFTDVGIRKNPYDHHHYLLHPSAQCQS